MSPYFTKRIETRYGAINFYFNRIYTVEGVRYHVSGVEKDKKVLIFTMKELLGIWHIANAISCPNWITALEPEFEKAILANLAP
jgi:hypothetical protein